MARYKKRQSFFTKKPVLLVAALLIIVGVLGTLEKTNVINLYGGKAQTTDDEAKTTSNVPSAQEDFNEGDVREPGNTIGEDEGSGTVQDLQGNSNEQTDKNRWTASATGEIVLHSPYSNQTLKSGDEISGTSSLSSVSYRIIDDISGVIAEGELSVVQGKFAGIINFTTSAKKGRLDIFGSQPDGREFSNIEVPIEFK